MPAKSNTAFDTALIDVESEGVDDAREQLLLWVIRNRHELSAEESYEFILEPGELVDGLTIDAAFVVVGRDIVSPIYVLLDESWAGLKKRTRETVDALREHDPERRFARRAPRFRSMFAAALEHDGELERVIMCVCTNALTAANRSRIKAEADDSVAHLDILDLPFLNALAEADTKPTSSVPPVTIEAPASSVLNLGMPGGAAIVLPIAAGQIADWPGVDDRTLFDLNVRHALGANRVRRSLDAALADRDGAHQFIAFHNGITAVCRSFTQTPTGIYVEGLSVVNGAQTVVAIHSNRGKIADGVRVMLKLVEASPDSDLARNIAIRSNTQNPVTSRNLRALDSTQERLRADAKALRYAYLVRPDDKEARHDERVIRNDDVAQLLCSMYVRKPALAVKRQVLFEEPNYHEIFPETLSIGRVIFAHIVRQAVEQARTAAPVLYQRAWSLTALTLFFMTSEALRSDPTFLDIMESPEAAVEDADGLRASLQVFVESATEALRDRQREFELLEKPDDFKVGFKQTRTLSDLGIAAAKHYRAANRFAQS